MGPELGGPGGPHETPGWCQRPQVELAVGHLWLGVGVGDLWLEMAVERLSLWGPGTLGLVLPLAWDRA